MKSMLGFIAPNPPIHTPIFAFSPLHFLQFSALPLKSHPIYKRNFKPYAAASASNNNNNGEERANNKNGNGNNKDGVKGNGRPRLNVKWFDLLRDPDPNNIVAVGLTGLLTWASVSVLWQLFVISLAILLAALKYSLIAALLIFILIALL